MIRFRVCICISAFIVLFLGAFGITYRKTYTNITSQPDYLDSFMVAEIPENFAEKDCEQLLENLPQVDYIFRIVVTGSLEQLFGISRQKVCIEEIYSGDGIQCGEEIYITTNRWTMSFHEDEKIIERGFVNILHEGQEYLVFCSEKIDTLNEDMSVYRLYEDSFITPVFCYEDSANIIVPSVEDTTYVSYEQVKFNEFFACSYEALAAWSNLKKAMLKQYPKM